MTTLTIGLLWYDDAQARAFDERVRLAVAAHVRRCGERPNVCYVNPSDLPRGEIVVDGVRVAGRRTVLRYHFWLGVENDNTKTNC